MKLKWLSRYGRYLTNAMVLFPFLYPLCTAIFFELSWKGIGNIFLMPTFYMTATTWIVTGFGIRRMRKWAWYSLNFALILTFYLNVITLVNFSDSSRKFAGFALSVLVLAHIYFSCRREMIVPYLFPRIRWWEFGIAGMNHVPIKIWSRPAAESPGQLLDLSGKGCFVKSPGDFKLFETIELVGEAYNNHFRFMGKVVWIAKSTVTHPRGIGVQFLELDKANRKKLKVISELFQKDQKNVPIIVDA